MRTIDFSKKIPSLIDLMDQADSIAMKYYLPENEEALDIKEKDGEGPVTKADLEINNYLSAELKKIIPAAGIVSEEGQTIDFNRSLLWQIDPIDGTKEFIKRNDEFTIMLALVLENFPILGFISHPPTGRLFYGGPNFGCFLRDKNSDQVIDLNLSEPVEFNFNHIKALISRSHHSVKDEEALQKLEVHERIPLGSGGYKMCQLLMGKADLFLKTSPNTYTWDVAAGHALLMARGGIVTGFDGKPIDYRDISSFSRGGLFASRSIRFWNQVFNSK